MFLHSFIEASCIYTLKLLRSIHGLDASLYVAPVQDALS